MTAERRCLPQFPQSSVAAFGPGGTRQFARDSSTAVPDRRPWLRLPARAPSWSQESAPCSSECFRIPAVPSPNGLGPASALEGGVPVGRFVRARETGISRELALAQSRFVLP